MSRGLIGVNAARGETGDRRFDPFDRRNAMTLLFDQPFIALALSAITTFALVLGYVSLTDRDPVEGGGPSA
ncbi:MAG: hypothetical protein C0476_01960 [Sphingomonas sp.]|nr:hypothetical protein [Sphingomonas sp.]